MHVMDYPRVYSIEYSRGAMRKLDSIHYYIEETLGSPAAARRVIGRIVAKISTLKENPTIGPKLSSRINTVPASFLETRFLICDKHIVIYNMEKERVLVMAIYHTTEDVFGRVLDELDW